MANFYVEGKTEAYPEWQTSTDHETSEEAIESMKEHYHYVQEQGENFPEDFETPETIEDNKTLKMRVVDEREKVIAIWPEPEGVKYPHVLIPLVGEDGNAVAILGRAGKAMRRAGVPGEEIEEFYNKAKSGDYYHLLNVVQETVNCDWD